MLKLKKKKKKKKKTENKEFYNTTKYTSFYFKFLKILYKYPTTI